MITPNAMQSNPIRIEKKIQDGHTGLKLLALWLTLPGRDYWAFYLLKIYKSGVVEGGNHPTCLKTRSLIARTQHGQYY
jgi:hypothetical protein